MSEWARLMRGYAKNQERHLAEEKIFAAMRWLDPERDVLQVRKIAVSMLGSRDLRCIWTDRPLSASTLDIDHMFPWAAWPNSDYRKRAPACLRSRVPNQEIFSLPRHCNASVCAMISKCRNGMAAFERWRDVWEVRHAPTETQSLGR